MTGFRGWRTDCTDPLVTEWSPYCHGYRPWSPGSSAGDSGRGRSISEKLLDFTEESGGFRLRFLGRQTLELRQQFTLPFGQALRRLDHDLHIHVARLARAQHRHALALQAEAAARLGALGDLHLGLAAVDGRHLELAAERGRHHRDRHAAMQVGAIALEEAVAADREEDVEVAGRAAARAGLALAGEPDAGAVLDPGRDVDRERAVALHAAGARAGRAWIVDHLAAPVAGRAGPLEREEAL